MDSRLRNGACAWLMALMAQVAVAAGGPPPIGKAPMEGAYGDEAVAPAPSDTGAAYGDDAIRNPDAISNGERITVREGDFSIKPPVGWEVFTQRPGLSLILQVPDQPGLRYRRTIQVMSVGEPRYIDEMTAQEYERIIVQRFSSIDAAIEDYRVRNHMLVEMSDGRRGLLFYTEFKLEGVALMQAHILVSSATRHYLVTYTDLAEHFEDDALSAYLTEAWESMISVELGSPTPQRFTLLVAAGTLVVFLVIGGVGFVLYRSWRSGRTYREFADGRGVDEVSGAPQSMVSNLTSLPRSQQSRVASDVSGPATSLDSTFGTEPEEGLTKEDIAI